MPLKLLGLVAGLSWIVPVWLAAQQMGREHSIEVIQEAIAAGNEARAKEEIASALSRYPGDGGILNLRGVLHARKGELAAAREDFAEAVRRSPNLLPAWENLGRACREAGAMDCALRSWKHVAAARPGDAEAHEALATLSEWNGDFAESERQIRLLPPEQAARLPVAALHCANLAGLGRMDEALAAAKQLSQSHGYSEEIAAAVFPVLKTAAGAPVLIALAEPLAQSGQASPDTLRRLGQAYEKAGRAADARKTIERAAVMAPGNTADLYELTRLAYQAGDREGALGYLGHIRAIAPEDARAHFLFGIIAVELELPVEARHSLEKALALDPKNPLYSMALGSVLLSSRDAGDAVPYFQTYLAAHPGDPRGHFGLGMAYFAASDFEKARAEMTGAAQHKETEGGAEYFLGRIGRAQDNLDDAAAHLERAIVLLPKFPDARAELAKVRLKQGEPEKARAQLQAALAMDADNYQANTTLLALYEKTHDPKATAQRARLKQLEAKRKDEEKLMFRTIEMRPF